MVQLFPSACASNKQSEEAIACIYRLAQPARNPVKEGSRQEDKGI
jgi:hypothetical protein